MARIVNYSKLSSIARRKVAAAGYKPAAGSKTASRKSSSSSRKSKETAAMKKAQSAIQTRGDKAYAAALKREKAANASVKKPATAQKPARDPSRSPAPSAPAPTIAQMQAEQKPKGWSNVRDVLNIALNPFSKQKISANVQNTTIKNLLEATSNNPFATAAFGMGAAGAVRGVISSVSRVIGKTTVLQVARVGTMGVPTVSKTTAATFATNTKNIAVTKSWLTKLAARFKNPQFVANGVMLSIGSYPFAGFIKEEALQTLGFGVRSATNIGDMEAANLAIEQQKEILDPDLWDQIKAKIPFVNVLDSLNKFYDAARTKLAIDEKVIADMQKQIETGETDDQRWTRAREEQSIEEQQSIDYYNSERKKMVTWEQEAYAAARLSNRAAEVKARNEDAAFWAKERARQRELEEKDRQAIADFWMQYRKAMQKISDDSRPSNLKFGLL